MEFDKEQVFITCEVCDLPFTDVKPFEQHMKGKMHRIMVKEKKTKALEGDEELNTEKTKGSDVEGYTCNICKKAFSGIIPHTQHFGSKLHAKALRKKEAHDSMKFKDEDSDSDLQGDDADLDEILKEILPQLYGSCVICDKKFGGPISYSQHMKSKSHLKCKRELQLMKKLKAALSTCQDSDEGNEISEDKSEMAKLTGNGGQKELKCKVCNKTFKETLSFAQHLTGKAHAKKQRKNEILENLKALEAKELEDNSYSSEEELPVEFTCQICNTPFFQVENAMTHFRSKKHKKIASLKKCISKKCKPVKQSTDVNDYQKSEDQAPIKNFNQSQDNSYVKIEDSESSTEDATDTEIKNIPESSSAISVAKSFFNSEDASDSTMLNENQAQEKQL